jgi:hypothetical protein
MTPNNGRIVGLTRLARLTAGSASARWFALLGLCAAYLQGGFGSFAFDLDT